MSREPEIGKEHKSSTYVYDALKERLPSNWSLKRADGPSISGTGEPSAFYSWTRWLDGTSMQIEIHERFADKIGIDALCDFVMEAVFESFADPLARFTTPHYKSGQTSIPRELLLKLAEEFNETPNE